MYAITRSQHFRGPSLARPNPPRHHPDAALLKPHPSPRTPHLLLRSRPGRQKLGSKMEPKVHHLPRRHVCPRFQPRQH